MDEKEEKISEKDKKDINDFLQNYDLEEDLKEEENDIEKNIENISLKDLNLVHNDTLIERKLNLYNHIQKKLIKFYDQQRLLEHKLSQVKYNHTFIILLLLFFSTVLTLVEAFQELYNFRNNYGSTIVLSTFITFLSSFSKVMKHQEILEELVKSLEKCLITQVELKKVQESLIFCPNIEEFDKIKNNYINNVYLSYLNCQMEIFKAVPKNHQLGIIKKIYNIDCNLREEYKNKLIKIKKIENQIHNNGYENNFENEL